MFFAVQSGRKSQKLNDTWPMAATVSRSVKLEIFSLPISASVQSAARLVHCCIASIVRRGPMYEGSVTQRRLRRQGGWLSLSLPCPQWSGQVFFLQTVKCFGGGVKGGFGVGLGAGALFFPTPCGGSFDVCCNCTASFLGVVSRGGAAGPLLHWDNLLDC